MEGADKSSDLQAEKIRIFPNCEMVSGKMPMVSRLALMLLPGRDDNKHQRFQNGAKKGPNDTTNGQNEQQTLFGQTNE